MWLRSLSVLLQLSTLEPEQASWAAAPLGEHLEPRPGRTGHVTCPPGLACPCPPRSQAAASTSHRCILGSWEAGSRKQRWPGSFSVPVPETATPNPFSLHMRKQAWVGDWPRSLPPPIHPQASSACTKPTGPPNPSSGFCCLISFMSQPKPGCSSPCSVQAFQGVLLKLTSDHFAPLPWHQVLVQSPRPQDFHSGPATNAEGTRVRS